MADLIQFALIALLTLGFQMHWEQRKTLKRLKAILDKVEGTDNG